MQNGNCLHKGLSESEKRHLLRRQCSVAGISLARQTSDKHTIWRTSLGSSWVRHCRAGRRRARWVTSVMLEHSMVTARPSGRRLLAPCSESLHGSSDATSVTAHWQTCLFFYTPTVVRSLHGDSPRHTIQLSVHASLFVIWSFKDHPTEHWAKILHSFL